MSEIAAVEYAVWNHCGGISEEDTYSCTTFEDYLEVLEEELLWAEGLRPKIRLFWQERLELWQE